MFTADSLCNQLDKMLKKTNNCSIIEQLQWVFVSTIDWEKRGTDMNFNVAVIPGDGIGPEIVAEAQKVLDTVGQKYGHTFH